MGAGDFGLSGDVGLPGGEVGRGVGDVGRCTTARGGDVADGVYGCFDGGDTCRCTGEVARGGDVDTVEGLADRFEGISIHNKLHQKQFQNGLEH